MVAIATGLHYPNHRRDVPAGGAKEPPGCGPLLVGLLLLVPMVLYKGFVLSWLVRWFLVPLGVPDLGPLACAGVLYTITCVRYRGDPHGNKSVSYWSVILGGFVLPSVDLGVGWVLKTLIPYLS